MAKQRTKIIIKPFEEMGKAEVLLRLFVSTITMSLVAFGGGFVMLSLLRKKYVDTYKWLKDNEITDYIALAQASPGTIIGNSTMLIGFWASGFLGAFVTMIASIIPPTIVITIIFFFYEIIKNNIYVSYIMSGLQAGVAAVIIQLVIEMSSKIFKTKNIISILIMLTAFAVTFFLKFSVIYLILIAITIGIATAYIKAIRDNKKVVNDKSNNDLVDNNKKINEIIIINTDKKNLIEKDSIKEADNDLS